MPFKKLYIFFLKATPAVVLFLFGNIAPNHLTL
jgi:hypothetical protein